MTKEKQIKDIARVLCDAHEPCSKCVWGRCDVGNTAIRLYEAGYRKQSEGEWIEQIKVARQSNKPPLLYYQCSLCGVYLATRANYCPTCGAKMKGGEE